MPATDARGAERRARLHGLYAVACGPEPVEQARAALAGGAGVVQLRLKAAPAGEILEAARRLVAEARGRALVIVNDRPDVALLAGADGVHLGDDDLPVAEARRLLGPSMLIGRSTRTLADARAALAAGADHVGFGPIFATRTKSIEVAPRGLASLREVAAALPAPVVAIGGIDEGSIGEVAAAGAAAAAVVADLFSNGDVRTRAERLSAAFARGEGRRA